MILWPEEIKTIVEKFKVLRKIGSDIPLDGDEVEELAEIIKVQIDFDEGNITDQEFKDQMAGFGL